MSIVIQTFYDYICPYCYLGETALSRAAAVTGAEIVHRAYQLSESDPSQLARSGERVNASWQNSIYPLAQMLGVEIRQPSRSPGTRLAHEAAAWARQQDNFASFHRRLFRAFFIEDKDIGELSVLKEIAWQAGLNPQEMEKALMEHQMADEVDEDLLIAQTYRVNTAPTFVIAGHLLRGMQEESVLIKAIELTRDGKLEAETRKLPHLPVNISRS